MDTINILFLCTGNSCRSQMAEGFGHNLKRENIKFYSAGIVKHGLNPYAVEVMKEIGIDISNQISQTVDDIPKVIFDIVFTVCSDAHETCPVFPGGRTIHIGFEDPPRLTKDMEDGEQKLNIYRKVRDEIKDFVSNIDKYLEEN